MAAAHSRPKTWVGQLYSINALVQVYDFPAGSSLVRSGRGQYFKRYSKLSTMTGMLRLVPVPFFLW